MALASGTKLGPYEIEVLLGAGGMGEVYRAKDTRLDRTVAIKVLPAQFSGDPVCRQRFEREAKTISSLNHPHICVLYDIGHQNGTDYLVMECVEGDTLANRLEKASLPLEQVLKYGAQIADALDKAHRAGIIHRDLKPGNIMLTSSGAKLLDFGLAKPAVPLSTAATLTVSASASPVTEHGTIVGTFQYMSPEQIEGMKLDARSDIFSLGAVLYEMLTGKKAFDGKSQLSITSAILEKDPAPIATIKPLTPPSLDHIIRRCLAKDPDERWQTAQDIAQELKWTATEGSRTSLVTARFPLIGKGKLVQRVAWVSVGLMAGAILVAAYVQLWRVPPKATAAVRFQIPAPEHTKIAPGPPWGPPLALSPDGKRLVFVAVGKDGTRLWLRSLDALTSQVLPGTENASAPFWSPDSLWIAFFADEQLKRIPVMGGEVQTLCRCQSGGGGGTWNQNGVILFSPALAGESGLVRVPATGGTPVPVTTLDKSYGETNHAWPLFLPDGRHFLYHRNSNDDRRAIYAGDLDSPNQLRLLPIDITSMNYASEGYLLYAENRVLFALSFDAKRLAVTGDPIRVVGPVEQSGPGSGAFSVSSNGILAYWGGAEPPLEQLTWVARDGTRISTVGLPGGYYHFSLSPNGRRVAVTAYDSGAKGISTAIWLLDAVRGTATKFTFDWGAGVPVWSPDGARIAFSYDNRPGPPTLYSKPTTGSGKHDLLVDEGGNQPTDWSPDGQVIVHEHRDGKTQNDLWLTTISGERKSRPLLGTPANETGGRISPDGRWIAYTSDESGRNEIYLTSFPEPLATTRISTDGGTQPEWRRDGSELFYRAPDRKLMAVPIKAGAIFDAGKPHALFELPPEPPAWIQGGVDQRVYAPSVDGRRFLIALPVGEGSYAPITVVVNWDAELKKK